MRDKRRKRESSDGSGDWITTYADMVTLLLCFFVLLYTFSVVDQERFMDVILGLRAKLGVLEGGRTFSKEEMVDDFDGLQIMEEMELTQREFETLYMQVEEYIYDSGLQEEVKVIFTKEGLVIRFVGRLLFDLGKDELREESKELLRQISDFLKDVQNEVTVEGHTDNWPIVTGIFPTNWELSTARATRVVRYFTEELALPPERFMAAGLGEHRPILPNDTEANRAQNRRVDLVIRRSYVGDLDF